MTDHLRAAAARRHNDTEKRATDALRAMSRQGVAVTFAAVARRAGVSTDFLYRHQTLRSRILDLRTYPTPRLGPPRQNVTETSPESGTSSAVRALAAQLKQARTSHRDEVARLKTALAAAHGENLLLRRQLARGDPNRLVSR